MPIQPLQGRGGGGEGRAARGLPASPFLSARGTPPAAARVSTRSTYERRWARSRRGALPPPNQRVGPAGRRGQGARLRLARAAQPLLCPAAPRNGGADVHFFGIPSEGANWTLPVPPRWWPREFWYLLALVIASGPLIPTPAGLEPCCADWSGAEAAAAAHSFPRGADNQTKSWPETDAASSSPLLA